jgi:2,4-dienoyl-CoA reductase-like NADH-dependent reductase (Old Yellow Enzyme family)
MSVVGVRRDKAALSSGCEPHPATAPAGSNRSSHGGNEVAEVIAAGADIITFGRGALATPDLPNRLAAKLPLNDFDPAILGPIADIKESELAYEPA